MNDETESASPIEGFITAAKQEFESGESKTLTFVLKNNSDADVKVLTWYTPLEGIVNGNETPIESPCLSVTSNGEEVEYDGKMKKREAIPPEEAYVNVKAGDSISVDFDLNQAYQVSSSGDYSVAFLGKPESSDGSIEFKYSSESPAETDEETAPIQQKLDGMTTGFKVKESSSEDGVNEPGRRPTEGEMARENSSNEEGEVAPKKDDALESPAALAPVILSAPTPQKEQDTINAHNQGFGLVINMLASLGNNPNYIEWFGAFNTARLNTVTGNYTVIRDRMRDTVFTYDLSGTGCTAGVFAYTYKGGTTVWMCEAFWRAPALGTDSKAGTVVHELSHAIARTDDIVYGQSGCRQLAVNNPDRAIKNADSHEYCAGG